MRVAMITSYPWDPELVPGGVTAVGAHMTRCLAAIPGIELHVVCCDPSVERDITTERDGATIHFLTDRVRFSAVTNRLPQRWKMARVLGRIRPDLVHAQGLGVPAAGALDSRCPRAVTVHGLMWNEPIEHPAWITRQGDRIRRRNAYRQAGRFRHVFITSGHVARSLPPEGDYRLVEVNNPVGEKVFAIRNRPERPHVLVVGGLRQRKDPMTSVRVMNRVLKEIPDATMHLLGVPGRTELDDQVADYIASCGMADRVKILGLVPNETLYEEYERASVLLMPSLEESAPVALGEACAVGLPQVGTDSGGIPDMIREGETGFVRPVGDVEALAERVTAILRDEGLRTRLAAGARALGQQEFAGEPIARRTVAAYEEILSG
ncbi:MAG: glycosyltransferase family 4 protein [Gemmatimonadota bacterium]|jgi:glycosyltransferase involved in cell wall biosynthesis|nr:hypothetical protein [Gemmatimonadota bacterium]MDP6460185.1 glycosyltransferase family 4 protein [Gemmatimonadota bacterium]MDP6528963.1 glycosyltransferase family 4 protein [Gemmatimonadota bacterium]MDP6802039.1 glycosyltransferase family 4 protein [Gemmatimonadota bacterium]MDP7031387.1 glycosyltransferase family 4 protein [Gemmatimonadota bacterium]